MTQIPSSTSNLATTRPFEHRYFIHRPRIQLKPHDRNNRNTLSSNELALSSRNDADQQILQYEDSMAPDASKVYANLFFDLVWAAVVRNIAETFTDTAFGEEANWSEAIAVFLVLFLTAWRMWNCLRMFVSLWFSKDLLQGTLIIWCFVLALTLGSQSIFFNTRDGIINVAGCYLVSRVSLIVIEGIYSAIVTSYRRHWAAATVAALLSMSAWLITIWVDFSITATLIIVAIMVEGAISVFLSNYVFKWSSRPHSKHTMDHDELVERLNGFFVSKFYYIVVLLGEGVLSVGTTPRVGLTVTLWASIMVLIILWNIFWQAFYGDYSKSYLRPQHMSRLNKWIHQVVHTPLYASLLIFIASVRVMVMGAEGPEAVNAVVTYSLRWTVSSSIVTVMVCLTIRSLMYKSLDAPGSLLVTNRYLRLLPRCIIMTLLLFLPFIPEVDSTTTIGVITLGTLLVNWLEYILGLERPAGFIEPSSD